MVNSEYQIKKYFSAMLNQSIVTKYNETMKISKKCNVFVYFIFPFINGLKKHFLDFSLMINLLVTCPIINIFLKV